MTLPGNLLQRWTRWRNRWKAEAEQTYHYRHRRSLLRALDRAMHRARPVVAATYGEAFVTGALTAARQAFIELLPCVPYIGGRRNRLTWNLVSSAWVLALYRALAARGVSLSEAGRLLTEGYAAYLEALPAWLHRLRGRYVFTRPGQARRYAGDWVYTVHQGPGDGFSVDYTECGILKFMQQQGSPELAPWLCALDFETCQRISLRLIRTQTLAGGASQCDFRFAPGGLWPARDPAGARPA